MIAETIASAYDAEGRKVFQPFNRRKAPRPTFPLGRYVSQPLSVHCHSVEEVRQFLKECKYVSDKELFDKDDYWQPPEDFEKRKKGDCDDFSFWTWRQFMDLGYQSRVVFGRNGRYGEGHAWVQFIQDGKCFIVEPLRRFGNTFPRLNTLRYQPRFSVAWDGEKLTYYQHRKNPSPPPIGGVVCLLPEYFFFWAKFWLGKPIRIIRIPRAIWLLLKHFISGFRWIGKTR